MSIADKINILYQLFMLRLSYIGGPLLRMVGLGHAIYRKECWGGAYPDKTFLVLRRGDNCGLCSYLTTMIGGFKYAHQHGYVPVVDMQTQKNIYLDASQVGKENAWEWYFKQPGGYSLSDIANAKNVVVALHWRWSGTPPMKMSYLKNRGGQLDKDRDIVKHHFQMQNAILQMIDRWAVELSLDQDTLGVFLRGTDYVEMKPYGHPRQPSVDNVIADVKREMTSKGKSKVYLVTEDKGVRQAFLNEFGENLKYIPQREADYAGGYIGDYAEKDVGTDLRKRGEDYLAAVALLARCGSVLASRANGSIVATLIASETCPFVYYNLGDYKLFEAARPNI